MNHNLAERLNCRVILYEGSETENELGEKDFTYHRIKSLWAEILPLSGRQLNGEGNTCFEEITHKFTIRSNVVSVLKNDMYFVFMGQRYDIKYFQPNYKYKDRIEVFCIQEVK